MKSGWTEFRWFFRLQVLSSVFPLILFAAFIATMGLSAGRYELLLLVCIAAQVWMIRSGRETVSEVWTLCLFHGAGLVLEIYKVTNGSWQYPLDSPTKIFGVPLFSGFMYASVASYILQAWNRFELRMINWPKAIYAWSAAIAIYLNFFLNRWFDFRWIATVAVCLIFARTLVEFNTSPGRRRRMPMLLAFFLIGFFVYVGENICSLTGIYVYPHQVEIWKPVTLGKLSSWSLLVILSVLLVHGLKRVRQTNCGFDSV